MKQHDENAKDSDRQVPMKIKGTQPEKYPDRLESSPKNKTRKRKPVPQRAL